MFEDPSAMHLLLLLAGVAGAGWNWPGEVGTGIAQRITCREVGVHLGERSTPKTLLSCDAMIDCAKSGPLCANLYLQKAILIMSSQVAGRWKIVPGN